MFLDRELDNAVQTLSVFFLSKSRLAMDTKPVNVKDSVIQQVNIVGRDQVNNYNCKKK
jgi:hypothetical protein